MPFLIVCGKYESPRTIEFREGMMNPTRVLNNLTVVEQHITREATDVDKAIELYTDDIVWESPARDLIFQGKEAVANNYRNMFSSIRDIEVQPLQRFATEDRVVDDAIVRFSLVGDGFVNAPVPIGTHVSLRLLHIFGMRDGKIGREEVYEVWPRSAGAESRHKFAANFFGVTALLSQVTGAFFSRCADTVFIWWQHHRARRELSDLLSLDDRTLADIGVSRFQVKYEAGKRFWQTPEPVRYKSAPRRPSHEKAPGSAAPSSAKPANYASSLNESKGLCKARMRHEN